MNVTGWSRSLEVSGGCQGIVSHAGLVLLRALSDRTELTGGLSRALASDRLLIHDRGRVLADLACAIADGAEVVSDFGVMGDQRELFGLLASVPTCWRALNEIAAGGGRPLARIAAGLMPPGAGPGPRLRPATAPCPGCGWRTRWQSR